MVPISLSRLISIRYVKSARPSAPFNCANASTPCRICFKTFASIAIIIKTIKNTTIIKTTGTTIA